jgi:hypothetical protein
MVRICVALIHMSQVYGVVFEGFQWDSVFDWTRKRQHEISFTNIPETMGSC